MIASSVVKRLAKKKATLSVAESITGGGLAAVITEVAGSSKVFLGGVIAYADEIKINQLDVDAKTIKKYFEDNVFECECSFVSIKIDNEFKNYRGWKKYILQ